MNIMQAVQTLNKNEQVYVQVKPANVPTVQEDMQSAINHAAQKAIDYLVSILENPAVDRKERINVARIILREGAIYKVAASKTGHTQENLY